MNNMKSISLLHLKTAGSAKWLRVVKEQNTEYSSLRSILEPKQGGTGGRTSSHKYTKKTNFLEKGKRFQNLYLEGHYDVTT